MHMHLEVLMPPTDNVESALAKIMAPFDEGGTDEGGNPNQHGFWDWYQIGGRWGGAKIEANLGKERLADFNKALIERKVTVSGLQFGKQTLQPASQVGMVDALWREMFPDSGLSVCPLFDHAPKVIDGDICKLSEVPDGLTAERVIIAGPSWKDDGTFSAEYMISEDIWNGVMHVKTQWDGQFKTAIDAFAENIKSYRDDYREKRTPKDDWLVVTVDYHS
jgi:hypothetical protein